jgi:hypothetical protein
MTTEHNSDPNSLRADPSEVGAVTPNSKLPGPGYACDGCRFRPE